MNEVYNGVYEDILRICSHMEFVASTDDLENDGRYEIWEIRFGNDKVIEVEFNEVADKQELKKLVDTTSPSDITFLVYDMEEDEEDIIASYSELSQAIKTEVRKR